VPTNEHGRLLIATALAAGCLPHTSAGPFVADLRFVASGLWVETCRMDIDMKPGESSEHLVATRHACAKRVVPVIADYAALGGLPTFGMAMQARTAAETGHFTSGVFVRDVAAFGSTLVVTKCQVAANADTVLVGPCGHERISIPAFGPRAAPPGETSAQPPVTSSSDWNHPYLVAGFDTVRFVRDAVLDRFTLVITSCEIAAKEYELVVGACDRRAFPLI